MGRSDRSMSNKSQESEGPEQGPTEEEIQNNDLQELSQEAQGQNQESQGQDTTPGSIDLTQASELINLYNSLSEAQSAIESLSVSVQNAAPILDASEEAEEEDQFITEGLSEELTQLDGQFNSINAFLNVLDAQSDSLRDRVNELLGEIRSDRLP